MRSLSALACGMVLTGWLGAQTARPPESHQSMARDGAAPVEAASRPAATPIADAHRAAAERIIAAALAQDDGWRKLEELCDDIGHRLSGSAGLERAIEWAQAKLRADGQENVRAEPVEVPKWVRGRESLEMTAPRSMPIPLLGLGGSVGTPPEGITAPVVVVSNEEELNALGDGAAGKIVLFNHAMPPFDPVRGTGYGSAVRFRVHGARWAQARGALAALVRSVTARSLRSPHTGAMSYADARAKIPTAAIAVEDAEMLARLQQRGVAVTLQLRMEARDEGTAPSANVVGEIVGREKPEEIVVIGGHIDSWDVGQGAHDDGSGCVITMEALHVLRKLNLRPRRTVRVVLWTNEENGLAGGKAYAKDHADELSRHVAALECDSGCFSPRGFNVGHEDPKREAAALVRMRDIVTLLEPLGAAKTGTGGGGADIGPMGRRGVLLLGHEVDSSTYFDYHHTHADTLDKVNPEHLRQNIAAVAVLAYVLAEMPERLDANAE